MIIRIPKYSKSFTSSPCEAAVTVWIPLWGTPPSSWLACKKLALAWVASDAALLV